jgi:Tfp pilus assembly protein PilO
VQVKTKNLLVGAIVVLLVGLLWYRVVYSPMQSSASKAKTAAHDADAQSVSLRRALQSATIDKKKAQSVSAQSLLAAVPADPAEASFLRSLDQIRVASGAAWQTITPGVPAPSVAGTSITVGITASGTEDQIARYLDGVMTLKRIFVVDNVTIGAGGGSANGSAPASAPAGAVFAGGLQQVTISGRIFSSATAASGTSTTPTTGAPAPTAKTSG